MKFIGRKKELEYLDSLYNSQKFEMLILHGRRRVGKTFLLSYFASLHKENTVFFTATKASEKSNVKAFCQELNEVLKVGDFLKSFESFSDVFSFFKSYEIKQKLVIIIDEFTYLSHSSKSFESELQLAIDKILKQKNVLLILCGSEEIIDNSSKPLYGRKTADLKLLPFDYKEAREFFPNYTNDQALICYCILGGIPLYLSLFDDKVSIRQNIIKHCLSTTGYLFNEVDTLLRMELQETYYYKNIMLAINAGNSTFNTIREKVGEDAAKTAKYLNVLINLGFVKKEVPCGEKEKTRNTLYSISDNYCSFYFAFIYKNQNMLNGLISPEVYYDRELTKQRLFAFVGYRFENVCKTYLMKMFFNSQLPFYAQDLGRWWGNNKIKRQNEEIDLVALDDDNALFCECKYTQEAFDEKELNDLIESSLCIDRPQKSFMIFSKNGVTKEVEKIIKDKPEFKVVKLEDLF